MNKKQAAGRLIASDLSFAYGAATVGEAAFALRLEHLEVCPGEVHALIGPNGCGKSTLLRLLCGLLPPAAGTILLDGDVLASLRREELARRLAFLPQEAMPLFAMRAWDVALLGRHPWSRGLGLAGASDLRLAGTALRRMNAEHLGGRLFHSLSGGERQRVLLASVLAQEPRFMLLDEPTAALDLHHQSEVFHLLRAEAARGLGVLVVTHDLTLAGHFADRITLMARGRAVGTGTAIEVLEESRLRQVYGEQVRVLADPVSGLPCVLPSAGRTAPAAERPAFDAPISTPLPPMENVVLGRTAAPVLTIGRFAAWIALFGLIALAAVLLAPGFGSESIAPVAALRGMLFRPEGAWSVPAQILALRLPRVAMGLLAGMALGGVGAAFQSLLRNPMAEPYTLGIASAASLGAVIALSFPALAFMLGPISGVQILAFIFALLSVLFLWRMSRRAGLGMPGLLLTGIAMGLVAAAAIMLLRFVASPLTARAMDQWFVGGVEVAGWREVLPCLPFGMLGMALILAQARQLNQIEFGEEMAMGRGVDVPRVQRLTLLGGSLATAAVVSVVGPIGFVGLLVPHMVRRWTGSDQRLVLPCSMLGGGALLVLADALARSLSIGGRGTELPVGILTSLVGGPVFLVLLSRSSWNARK